MRRSHLNHIGESEGAVGGDHSGHSDDNIIYNIFMCRARPCIQSPRIKYSYFEQNAKVEK